MAASLTSYLLVASSVACIVALLVYNMPELHSAGFEHTARTAVAGSPSLDATRLGSPLSPQVLLKLTNSSETDSRSMQASVLPVSARIFEAWSSAASE